MLIYNDLHIPFAPPNTTQNCYKYRVIRCYYGPNHHNSMGTWRDIRYPQRPGMMITRDRFFRRRFFALAEVTNCCANMTWLSWTTIWIILYLHDFEILFRRFCVVFFTRWVSCVVWPGHVFCTGWACQLTSNNCQRCYVWCYAAAS